MISLTLRRFKVPKPISYITLQKKYAGKIVALTKRRGKVVAAARDFKTLFKKIEKTKHKEEELVYSGPIEKYKTVSVYFN